jgi:exonuclease III
MKIVSWNCHYGLSNENAEIAEMKQTAFNELKIAADILVLLEITKNEYDIEKKNWKYHNWYWDDLYNEDSEIGVAIFSKEYEIKFTDEFNRNLRYVVPYLVVKNNMRFYLFAVWTKKVPEYYDDNVKHALEYYQNFLDKDCIFIGDYNTYAHSEDTAYGKLKNCAFKHSSSAKAGESTYLHTNGKSGIDDFCFATDEMYNKCTGFDIGDWDKYIKNNISDHCPLIVEFKIE